MASTTPNPVPPKAKAKQNPLAADDALALAAYNQNSENFRSLNTLMWQIPLIAMTLTGGLWFGVSKVEGMPGLRIALLLLAGACDLGLIVVLERLRFIMGRYLDWLRIGNPAGFVDAIGTSRWTGDRTVKTTFQIMLASAALISFLLLVGPMVQTAFTAKDDPRAAAVAWYDAHAASLADGYEGLSAEETHPKLFAQLSGKPPLKILDIGAGTGRDAAALAALGHHVTAVDPSAKMLRVAKALHANSDIAWVNDALPDLKRETGQNDIILLSAVWMHVPPADRVQAFDRLADLLAPGGSLYITLRLGPAEPARGVWSVDAEEIRTLAAAHRFQVQDLGRRPDLMGRNEVNWQALLLTRPK